MQVVRAPRGLRWREFVLAIGVGDAVLVAGGIGGTAVLLEVAAANFVPTPNILLWEAGLFVLWILSLRASGAYEPIAVGAARTATGAVGRALAFVLAVTVVAYFFAPLSVPRTLTILSPVVITSALLIWRMGIVRLRRYGWLQRRVILLGLEESTTRLAAVLTAERSRAPYRAVAFVTDEPDAPATLSDIPVLRGTGHLWRHAEQTGAAEIAVGRWQGLDATSQQDLIRCFEIGVVATDATALYEELTSRVMVAHVGTNWHNALPTHVPRAYDGLKRAVDVALSFLIAVVLSPLLVALALLVVIDDGLPIVYRQTRLGRRGAPYTIHKFRSMRRDAEAKGVAYAVPNDPRSTRLGRFLRPSGLDELPQLWDVLRGRMSLIGPRPERPEFVDRLAAEMPLYRARLLVRPGVVGWAEVHVPHAVDLDDHFARLEYDLYYLKRFGPSVDLAVISRALWLLLGGRRFRSAGRDAAPPQALAATATHGTGSTLR
jgi:exopolysaccharide biosynthesis polyprenyl glycosylphosphotransferase